MNSSSPRAHDQLKGSLILWTVAVVLFVVAIMVRCLYLEELPAYIHNDESATAIYITPPFFSEPADSPMWGQNNYGGHANFGAWIASLYIRAFGGKTLWAIRMGSMVCGVLSILFGALFVRSWMGLRAMLFFLVAVLPFHLHVHYSRTGFIYMQAAFFIALVAYLFGRFVHRPSAMNGFILGLSTGFALMVYSATHVLMGVLAVGVVVALMSPYARETFTKSRFSNSVGSLVAIFLGIGCAIGQYVYYAYTIGHTSRFMQQTVLRDEFREGVNREAGGSLTTVEIVWANFKRTIDFFYHGDGAMQYGLAESPLEVVGYSVFIFGILVLLYRSVKLDARAIFVVLLAITTIIGASLMVEASFSPHFIAFALVIPFAGAVALETGCRIIRLRSALLSALVAIIVLVPWARWNYTVYADLDQRKRTLDTFIMHLPIPRESVKTIVNYTPLITDLSESFYMLRYPNAKGSRVETSEAFNVPKNVMDLSAANGCPCLVVVPKESYAAVITALSGGKKRFREFSFDRLEAQMVYIE